jgi:hypothetical protein
VICTYFIQAVADRLHSKVAILVGHIYVYLLLEYLSLFLLRHRSGSLLVSTTSDSTEELRENYCYG